MGLSLSERDFDTVRRLVKEHAAVVLEPGKVYLVETRLAPLARGEGFFDLEELVECLRATAFGPLHERVVDAMTAHDTAFFRDIHPFEALRNSVLPDLVRRRAHERRIRIWCAASSSGQEPYTVAMLVREQLEALEGFEIEILATDLSEEMLARARRGRFAQLEVNRGLPARFLVKYFAKIGDEWELREELRRMVEFRVLNLAKPWPEIEPFDVVFLRNVMLYFDPEMRRELLAKVRRVLRDDATLFLGAAETTLHADDAFERVALGRSWGYRLRRARANA
jgi:chemotaxis protein methyltransferase CheR